jgi:TetR/AcrR family transcriptional repressor of nem operon
MNKPVGRKALSHERIVDAASRDLRRSGFHGVAVVDVMKSAGLTHGGFYAHFASREALLAEAVTRASDNAADAIKTQAKNFQGAGLSPFRAFVESYLSASHVEDCENGCPVAALCGEMPSQAGHVADASRHIVGNLRRLVLQFLPPRRAARDGVERRQHAGWCGAADARAGRYPARKSGNRCRQARPAGALRQLSAGKTMSEHSFDRLSIEI